MSTTLRRTREIAGPGLSGPGVRARMPLDRPPEHLILTRRADDESRRVFESMLADDKKVMQRTNFEEKTDARLRKKAIKARTDAIIADADAQLAARRGRLAELLATEEATYAEEAASLLETPIERLARMREKSRTMKEKRESERSAFAAKMTEELWNTNCEPLRTAINSQEQKLLNEDRLQQIEMKRTKQQYDAEVDALYDACWEEDRIAKEERDARDVAALNAGSRETQRGQIQQMEERQRQADLEKMATAELCKLRLQEAKELQEELAAQEKRKREKQRKLKSILDRDAEDRAAFNASNLGEELAAETALLDVLEQERQEEERRRVENKQRLASQQQEYFEYLKGFADRQAEFEAAVDTAIHDMGEQVWGERLKKMRAEREQRKALVTEIVKVRETQKAFRENVRKAEAEEKAAEGDRLKADIENLKLEEQQEKTKRLAAARAYQDELNQQIAERQAAAKAERDANAAAERTIQQSFQDTDKRIDLAVTAVKMNFTQQHK